MVSRLLVRLTNKQSSGIEAVKWLSILVLLCASMLITSPVRANAEMALSPNMQAVLLSKILLYERRFSRQDGVKVFVLGDPQIALAFKQS